MMKSLLRQPLLWFAAAATVLVLCFQPWDEVKRQNGLLTPVDEYEELSYRSFIDIQQSARTFAFPYLLRAVRTLTPSYAALPYFHVTLVILAGLVCYAGLRAIGFGGGLACGCASTLLFANALFNYGWLLIADSSALSLAILTLGSLLLVVGQPRRVLRWVLLAAGLFFTYQTRPDYVFLVGLVPLLGLLLRGMIVPWPGWRRQYKAMTVGLVAACALPLLVFCTMRAFQVGHFGLVAYGGVSATNVAGWFLTEDLVPQLPDDVRPLAVAIIQGRPEALPGLRMPISDTGSLEPDAFEIIRADDGDGPYTIMLRDVTYPAAMTLYGADPLELNRRLGDLSAAIVKARPQLYLQWVARSIRVSLGRMITHNNVLRPLLGLLAVMLGVWNLLYVTRRWSRQPACVNGNPRPMKDYSFEFHSMALIAASFALAKIVLASLVSAPTLRYIDPSGVFLPPLAIIAALTLWERIRFEWRGNSVGVADRTGATGAAALGGGPHFPTRHSAKNVAS